MSGVPRFSRKKELISYDLNLEEGLRTVRVGLSQAPPPPFSPSLLPSSFDVAPHFSSSCPHYSIRSISTTRLHRFRHGQVWRCSVGCLWKVPTYWILSTGHSAFIKSAFGTTLSLDGVTSPHLPLTGVTKLLTSNLIDFPFCLLFPFFLRCPSDFRLDLDHHSRRHPSQHVSC